MTEQITHTPGPWRVEHDAVAGHYEIVASNDEAIIAEVYYDADGEFGLAPFDARLIAAAPDLLAALGKAVEQYGKGGGPWNVPDDPGGWLGRSRAAIAKVKGGAA